MQRKHIKSSQRKQQGQRAQKGFKETQNTTRNVTVFDSPYIDYSASIFHSSPFSP